MPCVALYDKTSAAFEQVGVAERTPPTTDGEVGYRWKRRYGDLDRDRLKRLGGCEKGYGRLRGLVAEQAFDILEGGERLMSFSRRDAAHYACPHFGLRSSAVV